MQPTNPTLSNLYAHQHQQQPTSQYYSHFPPQNPNPYPLHLHRHLQIDPQFSTPAINPPDPPGSDTYFTSYPVNHGVGAYSAPIASGGVTYSQTIGVAPPPAYSADLLVHNWPPKEAAQQYANSLYATVGTVPQDGLQQLPSAIPTPSRWTNPTVAPHIPWKKLPKKIKIAQSAWCEICKIECNTKDILYQHKLGKKHLKNLEKLNSIATTSFHPHVQLAVPSNPIIGPPEKPKSSIPVPKKKKAETPEDLEMKRRKVLEGGAAANAVRTCRICNVICNSDTVFRFHLAGQKHSSMVKKSQGAGITGMF